MKRNVLRQRPMKLQCIALVLALLALVLFAAPAQAAEFRADEETVRIGANETVDGDLFVAGSTGTCSLRGRKSPFMGRSTAA